MSTTSDLPDDAVRDAFERARAEIKAERTRIRAEEDQFRKDGNHVMAHDREAQAWAINVALEALSRAEYPQPELFAAGPDAA